MTAIIAAAPVSAQLSEATQRLFRAVEVNDMGEVRAAMAAGADITAKNPAGKTAADIAVDKGHFIIAHFLLSERRSSKTAKKGSDRKPLRLKPAPKPPRKAAGKPPPRQAAPTAEAKTRPGVRKSIDLPPAKPVRLAKRKKPERFRLAPRKPAAPSQPVADITEEVAVATAPGVDQPDGRDPLRTGALSPPDEADGKQVAVENGAEPEGATEKRSLGAVGDFFQSLVDLVTPSDEVRPPKRTPAVPPPALEKAVAARPQMEDGDREASMPETEIPVDGEDGPDEMAALDEETLEDDELPPAAEDGPASSDDGIEMTIEEPEVDGLPDEAIEDGPMEETVLEDTDREDFPGGEKDSSTTSRTLGRIRGLISDDEPEDENGLPVVALPEPEDLPPAIGRRDEAAESVLRELAEQEHGRTDLPRGEFLDDPPTDTDERRTAAFDVPEASLPRPMASEALRNRLRRLREAVSRDVTVDPDAILMRRRAITRDPTVTPPDAAPATEMEQRSDILAERVLDRTRRLAPRRTPSGRFNDRLAEIRRMEKSQENVHGIPVEDGKTKTADESGAQSAEEESLIDRVAGFFTDEDKATEAPVEIRDVPEYRAAPSTGRAPEAPEDAPEIENLDAFDQPDETKPQVPGKLPPAFLDRLAGLFNEEEEKLVEGWTAQVKPSETAPLPPANVGAATSPWTTTVEKNMGEGQDPVVVQVAETPVIPPESADGEVEVVETGPFQPVPGPAADKRRMMAKAPYSDPLRSPAQKAEAKKKTFFGRLTQLFQPKDREDLPREDLLLEQDEKLSTTHDAIHHDDVKVASTSPVQPKTYWPITSLDRTKSPPPLPPAERPDVLTRTSLSGVSLTLGESVALVNTFPPGDGGLDPNNECVKKNRSTTFFCIAPVDWPEDLRPSFIVATILYTGPMSIARFDQGEANRFHALFNSADFERVVNFYQKRYGEPTEIWRRSIAPLAKPRQDNPTVSWRNRDPETNAVSHGQGRHQEQERQPGRVPQGRQLRAHDQEQRAQGRLVHGRQKDAEGDEDEHDLVQAVPDVGQAKSLQKSRRELDPQDDHIGHHAKRHFEHHRVRLRIPRQQQVIGLPIAAEIDDHGDRAERIAEQPAE